MEYTVHDQDFETVVLDEKLPVLVDFYADWCMPCKMMAPVVEKLADAYEGRLKVCKCNVDEAMMTAYTYKVMSIPTIILFKNGEIAYKTIGVTGEEELKKAIEAAI